MLVSPLEKTQQRNVRKDDIFFTIPDISVCLF
jgi:hypothetical protein